MSESDSIVHATFGFSQVSLSTPLVPQSVKVSLSEGGLMNIPVENDGTAGINFNLPAASRKRIILLEATASSNPYRQFIQVPVPDSDFDVAFFPEGGSLMQGTVCNVAFKAMKSNGQVAHVSGVIYDQDGIEISEFTSDYLGMGSFRHLSGKDKRYHAICQNDKGESKRFDLPGAVDRGYALSVSQVRDMVVVSVLKPAETEQYDELYLLAHTRGVVLSGGLWDRGEGVAVIPKEQFPSGVLHFILFDAGMNPVSERLCFINRQDQANVDCRPDREHYAARSPVKNSVTLTDSDGEPLQGSFSVAVTSDREVAPDSTSSILTQMLLTSDLRGFIENPAYYFRNTAASVWALDLLMRTQGWCRYDIAELAQGRFSFPSSPLEAGPVISGTVKTDFTP